MILRFCDWSPPAQWWQQFPRCQPREAGTGMILSPPTLHHLNPGMGVTTWGRSELQSPHPKPGRTRGVRQPRGHHHKELLAGALVPVKQLLCGSEHPDPWDQSVHTSRNSGWAEFAKLNYSPRKGGWDFIWVWFLALPSAVLDTAFPSGGSCTPAQTSVQQCQVARKCAPAQNLAAFPCWMNYL